MILLDAPPGTFNFALQPDHAAGSAQLARAWRMPAFLPRPIWDRLLAATARHDDGWKAVEDHPALSPDGKPLDFMNIPTAMHTAIWRRSVDLAADDPYIALLIAAHARYLYCHYNEGDTPEERAQAQALLEDLGERMNAFITTMRQGTTDEAAAVEPHHLEHARRLLSLFDALSLMLLGALPDDALSMTEPVAFDGQTAGLHITRHPQGASITPWPFRDGHVTLTTRVFHLDKAIFTGPADWQAQLRRARESHINWRLIP